MYIDAIDVFREKIEMFYRINCFWFWYFFSIILLKQSYRWILSYLSLHIRHDHCCWFLNLTLSFFIITFIILNKLSWKTITFIFCVKSQVYINEIKWFFIINIFEAFKIKYRGLVQGSWYHWLYALYPMTLKIS